jgi:hypothetical protein
MHQLEAARCFKEATRNMVVMCMCECGCLCFLTWVMFVTNPCSQTSRALHTRIARAARILSRNVARSYWP